MGVPIPVGSTPQLVSRSVSKPYLIYNQGSSTVYIGLDSSVSPSNFAFPLEAGNAMQWTQISSDVYAVSDIGNSSTVVITPEAAAVSIGQVTASISGQATALASSQLPVFLPAGSVPITLWDSLGTDLSPYASLVMQFGGSAMGGVNPQQSYRVIITQYDKNGNVLSQEQPGYFGSGLLRYTTQRRGYRVVVSAQNAVNLVNTSPLSNFIILGSAVNLPHSYYQFPGSSSIFGNFTDAGSMVQPTAKLANYVFNMTASQTGSVFIESYSGPVFMQLVGGASVGVTYLIRTDWGQGSGSLFSTPALSGASRFLQFTDFVFPELPLTLVGTNGASAQQGGASFIWQ
jgi:hypothetical protein